jgi:predicted transposase YdaD
MLNGPQVQRTYLDELGDFVEQPIGIRLMQLTITPEKQAPERARELIRQANQEDTGALSKKEIIDMVCTIAVYKFSKLSRDEVEAMLGLKLEETRVYQEASAEGRAKGRQEGEQAGILKGEKAGILKGEQALILRQLTYRVGHLAPEVLVQVQSLSLAQLESLGEALLDFSQLDDLMNWLNQS